MAALEELNGQQLPQNFLGVSMFVSSTCVHSRSLKRIGKSEKCSSFFSGSERLHYISYPRSCLRPFGNLFVRLDYGAFVSDSWMKNLLIVTGVATTFWFFSILDRLLEERRKAELLEQGATKCPLCDGTGYIDCLCTKWTFPSGVAASRRRTFNCTRCHGSQKERCPRCGGGGLLSPIPAPVRVDVN